MASTDHLSVRSYQLEILNAALQGNTLAFLPTGAGKTLISVLLIKHHIEIVRKRVLEGQPKKCIAFLAPTKVLVAQQFRYITGNCDAVVRSYTGDTTSEGDVLVDKWCAHTWTSELRAVDVMVMTSEILRNILERKFLSVTDFELIVLDECHHANGSSPMAVVCDIVRETVETKPRIFGMTASPLQCKKGNIYWKIHALEQTTGCRLVAPMETDELRKYAPRPRFSILVHPRSLWADKDFKIYPWQEKQYVDPVAAPTLCLQHCYLRTRHGAWIEEIRVLLHTLQERAGNVPQLAGIRLLLEKTKNKHLSACILGDMQQLIGQIIKVVEDGGVLCGLHALVVALGSSEKEESLRWRQDNASEEKKYSRRSQRSNNMAPRTTTYIDWDRFQNMANDILAGPFSVRQEHSVLCDTSALMLFSLLDVFASLALSMGPHRCRAAASRLSKSNDGGWHSVVTRILENSVESGSGSPSLLTFTVGSLGVVSSPLLSPFDFESLVKSGFAEMSNKIGEAAHTLLVAMTVHDLICTTLSIDGGNESILDYNLQLPPESYQSINLATARSLQLPSSQSFCELQAFTKLEGPHLITPKVSTCFRDIVSRGESRLVRDLVKISVGNDTDRNSMYNDSSGGINGNRAHNVDYDEWAAIVFCRMRLSAVTLSNLLQRTLDAVKQCVIENENQECSPNVYSSLIRPGHIIGGCHAKYLNNRLWEFKTGLFNVLFATDMAEEGLDMRSCQRIINFDPPSTVKSYVQRRGRARASNSVMITLVSDDEDGIKVMDGTQDIIFQEAEMDNYDINHRQPENMRPGESCVTGVELRSQYELCDTQYVVEHSGARADVNNSTQLLFQYCQQIPHDKYFFPDPIFWIATQKAYQFDSDEAVCEPTSMTVYRCSVLLPNSVPAGIRCAIGPPARTKSLAKSLVSLICLRNLHRYGELDHWLLASNSFTSAHRRQTNCDIAESGEKSSSTSGNGRSGNVPKKYIENNPDTITTVNIKMVPDCVTPKNSGASLPKLLYMYRFIAKCDNCVHESYINSCALCSRHLHAMNAFGVAFLRELPSEVAAETMNLYVRGVQVNISLVSLGSKVVTLPELDAMQRFHRAVLCWEVDENESDTKSSLESIIGSRWCSNSNKAWYMLFPVGEKLINMASNASSSSEYVQSTDSTIPGWSRLAEYSISAETLTKNLVRHHERICETECSGDHPRKGSPEEYLAGDAVCYESLTNVLFSRGYNRIYIGINDPHELKSLCDVMKSTTAGSKCMPVTFKEHYLSKNRISPSEVARIESDPSHRLVHAASVSGRLSLVQVLDKVVTENIIDQEHSHVSIQHLLPEQCVVLGDALWFLVGQVAPSMMWRVMSLLLALEARDHIMATLPLPVPLHIIQSAVDMDYPKESTCACENYRNVRLPSPKLVLEALTPRMTKEVLDSERLEFFGDCILKYISTWAVYNIFPGKHEGHLTRARMKIISNEYLTMCARASGMVQYMRAHALSNGKQELRFCPPGRCQSFRNTKSVWNLDITKPRDSVKEQSKGDTDEFMLSQHAPVDVKAKKIADVMEALLGCFYEAGGENLTVALIRAFGLWPQTNIYTREDTITDCVTSVCSNRDEELVIPEGYPEQLERIARGSIEQSKFPPANTPYSNMATRRSYLCATAIDIIHSKIGYRFTNFSLMDQALTHCSVLHKASNQRLEFLGDAILDFAVVCVLYSSLPRASQGQLSSIKSKLLCNRNLALIGLDIDLYQSMTVMSSALIQQFGDMQEWKLRKADVVANENHEYEKLRDKFACMGGGKVLADAMEALVGAVFIDSQCSIQAVRDVVKHTKIIPESFFTDPYSILDPTSSNTTN